jgi:hypothetical protein
MSLPKLFIVRKRRLYWGGPNAFRFCQPAEPQLTILATASRRFSLKNLVTVRYYSVVKRGECCKLSTLTLWIVSRFVVGFEGVLFVDMVNLIVTGELHRGSHLTGFLSYSFLVRAGEPPTRDEPHQQGVAFGVYVCG